MAKSKEAAVIGTKEVLYLVKKIKLVEGLCERELTNPEGSGLELGVGEVYKFSKKHQEDNGGFLGVNDRHTPETELVAQFGVQKGIILRPGQYRLLRTIEKLNLPANIRADFAPRSTFLRSGVIFVCTGVNPGYSGQLTFGLYNACSEPFNLELGSRIVQVNFYKTGENVSAYRGQWKGGRVSTEGKRERQV